MADLEEAQFRAEVANSLDRIATALEFMTDPAGAFIQNIAQAADSLNALAADLHAIVNPERMGGRKEHDAFVRVGVYDLGGDPR